MQFQFHIVFQLSKTKIFDVEYIHRKGNSNPYVVTHAMEFNRPKTDYIQCGQAQEDVCKSFPLAMNFYRKWDNGHSKQLSEQEFSDMLEHLTKLKNGYNFIESTAFMNETLVEFNFSDIRALSMQKPK